jgi:cytochrome P450
MRRGSRRHAQLARMETKAAISGLLRRFQRLERAPGELRWLPNHMLRTLVSLPVRLA